MSNVNSVVVPGIARKVQISQNMDGFLPRTRTGGGGGRNSEFMDALRNLAPNSYVTLEFEGTTGDEFTAAVNSKRASVSGLPFRAVTRTSLASRTLQIARPEGSDYAKNPDGTFVVMKGVRENGKAYEIKLTVAEVAEQRDNAEAQAAGAAATAGTPA